MNHVAEKSPKPALIETERLSLRELTVNDAAFMLELMNEPAFIRNIADRGLRSVEEAERYLTEKYLGSYRKLGFGFYRVDLKAEAKPIGICGLIKREALPDVDIGFSLLESYWGHGYAYEAASAVLDYARHTLQLSRIVAITASHNQSSIRLLGKLGLRFEKRVNLPGYKGESLLFS